MSTSRKLALIVGTSDYDDSTLAKLKTPDADVRALAEILRDPIIGGFDSVTTLVNQLESDVSRTIESFFAQKKPDDLLLLYFSGHGVLDDRGRLFLAVKDTRRELLKSTAIAAAFVTGEMDYCRSKRQVLILDCCHSGAFERGAKGDMQAVNETTFEGNGYGRIVLTASDSTQYALEGDQIIAQAELSLFTHFLIQGLQTGKADIDGDGRITLDELYEYVHAQVLNQTRKQTPQKWGYKLQGELLIAMNPHPSKKKVGELPVDLRQAIESPFAGIRAGVVDELTRLLSGSDEAIALAAREALTRLKTDDSRKVSEKAGAALGLSTYTTPLPIKAQVEAERSVESPVDKKRRTPPREEVSPKPAPPKITPQITKIEQPIDLELARIPAGEFLMGSDPAKDKRAGYSDQPQHRVFVSEFYISKYPITNAQYATFIKTTEYRTPEHWVGDKIPSGKENHPIVNISWDDAVAFCQWLSGEASRLFRLPTEAEWEKAARGTEGAIYPWGDEWNFKKANCKESRIGDTTPVGKYSPDGDSPYGVAEMIGNVWEWCWDEYNAQAYWQRQNSTVKDPIGVVKDSQRRLIRGGSFKNDNPHVRCAYRGQQESSKRFYDIGFRVVSPTIAR